MPKNDLQYGGWNSYTLRCGTIMTLISPGDCNLQCGIIIIIIIIIKRILFKCR